MFKTNRIYELCLELLEKHGFAYKFWPQWCSLQKSLEDREEIIIGAILTQRTSWHNVELALTNLRKVNLLSLKKIAGLSDLEVLEILIRPAGFNKTKTMRLFHLCKFIIEEYNNLENFMKEETKTARERLLSLSGIGPETADTILLYAMDKLSFVVDEYTRRLVKRKKMADKYSYDYLKNIFEKNLPLDIKVYQDFHVLIIVEERGEKE